MSTVPSSADEVTKQPDVEVYPDPTALDEQLNIASQASTAAPTASDEQELKAEEDTLDANVCGTIEEDTNVDVMTEAMIVCNEIEGESGNAAHTNNETKLAAQEVEIAKDEKEAVNQGDAPNSANGVASPEGKESTKEATNEETEEITKVQEDQKKEDVQPAAKAASLLKAGVASRLSAAESKAGLAKLATAEATPSTTPALHYSRPPAPPRKGNSSGNGAPFLTLSRSPRNLTVPAHMMKSGTFSNMKQPRSYGSSGLSKSLSSTSGLSKSLSSTSRDGKSFGSMDGPKKFYGLSKSFSGTTATTTASQATTLRPQSSNIAPTLTRSRSTPNPLSHSAPNPRTNSLSRSVLNVPTHLMKSGALANMKQARSCTNLGLSTNCSTNMVPTTFAMQGIAPKKMSIREEVERKLALGKQKLSRPRLEQGQAEQLGLAIGAAGAGAKGNPLLQQR
jgi:hypothetical protein